MVDLVLQRSGFECIGRDVDVVASFRQLSGDGDQGRPLDIAGAGGNITDLSTRLVGDLYVLIAEVDLPIEVSVEALRREISRVAAELGVDASLRPVERDDL